MDPTRSLDTPRPCYAAYPIIAAYRPHDCRVAASGAPTGPNLAEAVGRSSLEARAGEVKRTTWRRVGGANEGAHGVDRRPVVTLTRCVVSSAFWSRRRRPPPPSVQRVCSNHLSRVHRL